MHRRHHLLLIRFAIGLLVWRRHHFFFFNISYQSNWTWEKWCLSADSLFFLPLMTGQKDNLCFLWHGVERLLTNHHQKKKKEKTNFSQPKITNTSTFLLSEAQQKNALVNPPPQFGNECKH
jgi:hypothetical protein